MLVNNNYVYCSGEHDDNSETICSFRNNCKRYTIDRSVMVNYSYMKFAPYNKKYDTCNGYFDPIQKENFQNNSEFSLDEIISNEEFDIDFEGAQIIGIL